MDRLKNEGEGTAPETQTQNSTQDNDQTKAANKQKQDDQRKENENKDKTEEGLLLAIDGAKIKFNAHMGTFKVLNNVPTTQDKLTGTVVEKQIPNFIFDDGFQMLTLAEWQDFGSAKVQENFVLLKKSTLPGTGKMPGSVPPETGKIEFVTSGQVNAPESIDGNGAPVPDPEDDKKCFCDKEFTEDDIKGFYNSMKLFTAKNCPLPDDKKSYKEFTKALNKAMKDNDINSCLRKAHFLAQVEAETGLNTTLEYADGWDYDPTTHLENYNKYLLFKKDKVKYKENGTARILRGHNRYLECLSHENDTKGDGPKYKGRGLIQLTWKDTYKAYFAKIKKPDTQDPDIVANDLEHVCNSAAWYWRNRSSWGDLNKFADNDDFISAAVGVNGGLTGFTHRKENLKRILKNMKVKDNCKNQKIKNLGVYTYDTSAIKDTKWGKREKNKKEIQGYDDKES